MPVTGVIRESGLARSPRILQMSALFDPAPEKHMRLERDVNLPLDERATWNVGSGA